MRLATLKRGKLEALMAKKSAIENNKRKARLVKKFAARRKRLLDIANDEQHVDGGAVRGAPEARRDAAQSAPPAACATAAR